MIELTKAKFEDPQNDFLKIPGNEIDIKAEELLPIGDKGFQLENIDAIKRMVFGRLANNESLPFSEGSFDCYLGNLSLMLVDNYNNMLTEALRVTQSGGTFGFTIYGREGNFQNYEMLVDVFIRHDLMPKPTASNPPKKTIYDLSRDPSKLREEMHGMSFTNIRMWYQPMNFNFKNAGEYCACYCETVTARNILGKIPLDKAEAFKEDLKAEFNKRMGPGVMNPNSFEILVITA